MAETHDSPKPSKKSPSQKRAEKEAERGEWTQEAIDAAMKFPKGKDEEPKEEERRGPGRPSKYPTIDLERVQAWAAGGLTKAEIAENCGIAYDTLREYEKEFPAFSEAIARGRARDITDIEDALHKAAKGYTYMEEKLQYDTQVGKWARETVIKHSNPDTKAALAILQHAETGSWKPKTDVEMKFPEPLVLKSLTSGQTLASLGVAESKE